MTLTRHSRFLRSPEAFIRAFGDPITFTTQADGEKVFGAIVREEADTLNAGAGGVGTMATFVFLKLPTVDADQLVEGDSFVHQEITFKIASAPEPDGRGMTGFECERVENTQTE